MKKELGAQSNQAVSSPTQMIQLAISSGADLEKLEKLLTLQERWESNEARKNYHTAMAQFKANPPKIDKDRTVAYGNTKYNHASLGNVTEKISAELSKYGLSASWTTQQNGAVSVTCQITHEKGHSEKTTLTAPADSSGSKNTIQAIGSTITYLERYTLLALTGLATYEQDDDGILAGKLIVEMPKAKMPVNAPSVPKDESRVSAPVSAKNPQHGEDSQSKPAPAGDGGEQESVESPISAEEGLALMKTACKNGWAPKDVKEYIHGLGYDNIKKLTKWDLPTVAKFFAVMRSDYDNRKKDTAK